MYYFKKITHKLCLRHALGVLFFIVIANAPSLADNNNVIANKNSTITILTNDWPPYINKKNAPLGSAVLALEVLASELNTNIKWKYLPYSANYDFISRKKHLLSFPWFKTSKRSKEVLFSKPLFTVTSRLYFNRQFQSINFVKEKWNTLRIGKVNGYSYGDSLDKKVGKATAYPSEISALQALLDNEIDILPMTEQVMMNILKNNFPNQKELIRIVPNISDSSSLYLIASKTIQGKELIDQFDNAFSAMQGTIFTEKKQKKQKKHSTDLARLVSAEGYPVILGQSSKDNLNTSYYVLPQGSRVLVLQWSPKILKSSKTDRLYKSMIDVSRVVILNGPHVGKELFVRNMHISLL